MNMHGALFFFACMHDSGGSRNFKIQKGGRGPGPLEFFSRPGVCFDAPSHIPYVFVARVVNKILV